MQSFLRYPEIKKGKKKKSQKIIARIKPLEENLISFYTDEELEKIIFLGLEEN